MNNLANPLEMEGLESNSMHSFVLCFSITIILEDILCDTRRESVNLLLVTYTFFLQKSFKISLNPLKRGNLMMNSWCCSLAIPCQQQISKLVKNLEEMFPRYFMQGDMFSMFMSSMTHRCVICRVRVNIEFKIASSRTYNQNNINDD